MTTVLELLGMGRRRNGPLRRCLTKGEQVSAMIRRLLTCHNACYICDQDQNLQPCLTQLSVSSDPACRAPTA